MTTINETPNKWIPSIGVRKYIYAVFAAALPIFGTSLGLSDNDLPTYINLAAIVLGLAGGAASAMSAVNTPKPVEVANEVAADPELTEAESRQLEKERLMKLFADVQEQGPIVDVDQFGESARKRSL